VFSGVDLPQPMPQGVNLLEVPVGHGDRFGLGMVKQELPQLSQRAQLLSAQGRCVDQVGGDDDRPVRRL
jgi:hypothetical protein